MSEQRTAAGTGLVLALLSAATFGTSGTFATSLIDAGWTPGAAVTARISIAALILTIPALIQLRRNWPTLRSSDLWSSARLVALYGLVAVAGCQLFYFNSVQRLSVGISLLLEYLGIILVVFWLWIRHGHRPRRLTVFGSVGALAGLVLVLDLTGGQRLDPIGVLWGLGAAVGLAVYYVVSARADEALPPLVMAWAAMVLGAVTLWIFAALGALPMRATYGQVHFAGHRASWLVPVLGLSIIAAAFAYVVGIGAARMLGAKLASFVGLTEVLFAVFFAWLLLGELPAPIQLAGGALIIGGVALVRIDELRALSNDNALPNEIYEELTPAGSQPPTR